MKQDVFFSTNEMATQNWCYVVLCRIRDTGADGGWTEWVAPQFLTGKPWHFRDEADAQKELEWFLVYEERRVGLKILEFKVEPKYIGYIPDKDETWII